MIVAMQENATEEQIDAVIEAMEEAGVDVHRTTGATQTILAAVGSTASLDLNKFEVFPGVLHVHRISSPYKLAGRAFHPEGTVVQFPNGSTIGGEKVAIIAGPCAVENREQIFAIAECVKGAGGGFLRGGAFKPRSSPYAFQGLGIPGLQMMREAADAHGLLTVSEVMEIAQIEAMMPYVDCFQVGARNMQNFNLLRELGQVRKPILLKRGIAATIEELLLSSEYIFRRQLRRDSVRARHSHLRDRDAQHHGYRGHSGGEEAVAPADRRRPSHGTGLRDMAPAMAKAAVAAGADAILVEIHPMRTRRHRMRRRRCTLDQFEKLVRELRVIATAVGRTL